MFNRLKLQPNQLSNLYMRCASCHYTLFPQNYISQFICYDDKDLGKLKKQFNNPFKYGVFDKRIETLDYFILKPDISSLSTFKIDYKKNLYFPIYPYLFMYALEISCENCGFSLGIKIETVNENTKWLQGKILINVQRCESKFQSKQQLKLVTQELRKRLKQQIERRVISQKCRQHFSSKREQRVSKKRKNNFKQQDEFSQNKILICNKINYDIRKSLNRDEKRQISEKKRICPSVDLKNTIEINNNTDRNYRQIQKKQEQINVYYDDIQQKKEFDQYYKRFEQEYNDKSSQTSIQDKQEQILMRSLIKSTNKAQRNWLSLRIYINLLELQKINRKNHIENQESNGTYSTYTINGRNHIINQNYQDQQPTYLSKYDTNYKQISQLRKNYDIELDLEKIKESKNTMSQDQEGDQQQWYSQQQQREEKQDNLVTQNTNNLKQSQNLITFSMNQNIDELKSNLVQYRKSLLNYCKTQLWQPYEAIELNSSIINQLEKYKYLFDINERKYYITQYEMRYCRQIMKQSVIKLLIAQKGKQKNMKRKAGRRNYMNNRERMGMASYRRYINY